MQKSVSCSHEELISDTQIPIRIAFLHTNGVPGVLSLWYVQKGDRIYCATQKNSKIVSYLQQNPQCGFEIAADKPPYKGLRGNGIAKILEDKDSEILEILMKKYLGNKQSTLSEFLKKNSKNEVAIEITPQKIFNYDYSKRMKDV